MKRLRNRPDRISLVPQDLDFSSIDVRDTNPFYSFFILSFYPSRSNFKDKIPTVSPYPCREGIAVISTFTGGKIMDAEKVGRAIGTALDVLGGLMGIFVVVVPI